MSNCECRFEHVEGHTPVGSSHGARRRSGLKGREARSKDVESPSHEKVMLKLDAINFEESVKCECIWFICSPGERQHVRGRKRKDSPVRRLKLWQE